MPSIVTGIIGGIQGASAAHNAAAAQKKGYTDAAASVNSAVANANPLLSAAANTAGANMSTASTNAGTDVRGAAKNAGDTVTGAAVGAGQDASIAAGNAGAAVSQAAGGANAQLNPWTSSGSTATDKLGNLNGIGNFSFNPSDLANSPGYQFTLAQGQRGINAGNAASGMRGSGAALKAAATYATGLSDTTYNTRYNQALQGYGANLQGYQSLLNTYLPQSQMGLAAAGQSGQNLIGAAQYGGNTAINAAQYGGSALMNAAQYAGNADMTGAQYAGNANINAAQYGGNAGMWAGGTQAQNLINAGVYTGNTQIGTGNAIAQGNMGAANAWNGMLGSIGSGANSLFAAGFGGGGGWSPSNIGTNLGGLWGAGGRSGTGVGYGDGRQAEGG